MEFGEYIRHGDLLFKKVESIPKTGVTKLQTRIVAEGEFTGHAHEFSGGLVQLYADDAKADTTYVEVSEDTVLTHQEHESIPFEAGSYIVSLEQEYDPFQEEIRKVQD